MKIAVLGANGFVGRNLSEHLEQSHEVVRVTRHTLDLLDPIAVHLFLKDNMFDIVLNCAAVMTNNESLHDARNNLGLFMNFYANPNFFKKFINMASGAEFDRSASIDYAPEGLIFSKQPTHSYGWGQNIKSRMCAQTLNYYNIRIFNCFGPGEQSTRILSKYTTEGKIDISNDRYFDYFSIQDLKKVVQHCIENDWPINDVNAVYEEKYKISEMIVKYDRLHNRMPKVKLISTSENNYTGDSTALYSLGIELDGLEKGLAQYVPN
jgi:GDP-L-fucose synthase